MDVALQSCLNNAYSLSLSLSCANKKLAHLTVVFRLIHAELGIKPGYLLNGSAEPERKPYF